MKFRTEINFQKSDSPIEHNEKLLTIGSCFAENIAAYFRNNRFSVISNPFGVLYNPLSILNSIKFLKDRKEFSEEDLIFHQGEWHSYYHHSDFSHHDKDQCLANINEKAERAADYSNEAERVIITFGTSYVYNFVEKNILVSNCHKIPQSKFTRILLDIDDIVSSIKSATEILTNINPNIKILFTVSPIRHMKDGAVNNQLSKAQLIYSVQKIVGENENCSYFPSYEIMMDDLRDYRFYDSDLLHPNKIATDYIWEIFSQTMLSPECNSIIAEIDKIVKAKNHRIRNRESESTKSFAEDNINLISSLISKYEHIDLTEELSYFEDLIS